MNNKVKANLKHFDFLLSVFTSVMRMQIQDPEPLCPLDQESGIGFSGSRILDPGWEMIMNLDPG
jgi:hypothetical protein